VKLREVKLQNFRGYKDEASITIDNLTVLIGCNDAGKSSILDALNIFFNDADIEREDACVLGNANDVPISCAFSELPDENMTAALLAQSDPGGEIVGWLKAVGARLAS
jgi:putative ATP-dependent endonuclease of the OLD family